MIRGDSQPSPPTLEAAIELRDGRRLAYSAIGAAGGHPVAYLHGAIGSPRWRTPDLDARVASLGLRYVVVHRPGFSSSDPLPGRTVAAFAADLSELADALGWERFSVLGVSAGAPYALGCARALGERLAAATAVSPLLPPSVARRGRGLPLRYTATLAAFSAPGIGTAAAEAALRAFGLRGTTSPRAMIDDYLVCCRPWGFEVGDVRAPVELWHARRDRLVPVDHARRLAAELPRATLRLAPSGGHFFLRSYLPEILGPLAAPGAARPPLRLAA